MAKNKTTDADLVPVELVSPVSHDGVDHAPGDVLSLSPDAAAALIACGAAAAPAAPAEPPVDPTAAPA